MADYGCLIGWDRVAIGRERKALEVWADALAFYEKAKANGIIESFETLGFESNANFLGCILLHGERDKINDFMQSPDFVALQQRASMVVDHLTVVRFQTGQAALDTIGRYMDAIELVGV